jgi:hypothetical protein
MARIDQLQGNAVDKPCCQCCRELQSARKQLVDLRVTFFLLCLKYLPPGMEFTPDNLLNVMLKKGGSK